MAVFNYIEGFHNLLRRHFALGYRSPVVYEQETGPEPSTEPLLSQIPRPSTKTALAHFAWITRPIDSGR